MSGVEKRKEDEKRKKLFSSFLSFSFPLFLSPVERRVELGAVRERARVVHGDFVAGLRLDGANLGAGLFFFGWLVFRGFDEVSRFRARKEKQEKKREHAARSFPPLFRASLVLILIGTIKMSRFRAPI